MRLVGIGASEGKTFGEAFVCWEEGMMETGVGILVAEYIPPTIINIGKGIKGIIVEESSILCHAACIAREMSIPCVVGIEGCCEKLNGKTITMLDGEEGIVDYV